VLGILSSTSGSSPFTQPVSCPLSPHHNTDKTPAISYVYLYHWHDLALGFKGVWRSVRKRSTITEGDEDLAEDIHFKLMKAYPEVPEWWFMIVLAIAATLGMIGIGVYPTHSSPATVIFGIVMAIICIIPVGMITAVTGIQVTMNVLAEFIGGSISAGNAIEMNFFKMYGYVTTAQAIFFSNDLKLAHYTKIPPRHTFAAQMIAVLISTFVCTGIFQLPAYIQKRLHQRRVFWLHMPWSKHLLHRVRLLGYSQCQEAVRARPTIQQPPHWIPCRSRHAVP